MYDNDGFPDLTVDPQRFVSQMGIVDRLFDPTGCEVQEGLVEAPGYRRILRFDVVIVNGGDGDLIVGDRSDPMNPYAEWFIFSPCHGHHHIRDFSSYQLLHLDRTVAAQGHKAAFCFATATIVRSRASRPGGGTGTTSCLMVNGSISVSTSYA